MGWRRASARTETPHGSYGRAETISFELPRDESGLRCGDQLLRRPPIPATMLAQ